MRVTFHGVTVEVTDERIHALDTQRVTAALLKYAADIHEEWCREPRDFDPPILVTNLTIRTSRAGLIFEGSIRHRPWALEVRR